MATVLDLEVVAEDVFKLMDPRDQNIMLDHLVTLRKQASWKKAEKSEPGLKVMAMTVAILTEGGRLEGYWSERTDSSKNETRIFVDDLALWGDTEDEVTVPPYFIHLFLQVMFS